MYTKILAQGTNLVPEPQVWTTLVYSVSRLHGYRATRAIEGLYTWAEFMFLFWVGQLYVNTGS